MGDKGVTRRAIWGFTEISKRRTTWHQSYEYLPSILIHRNSQLSASEDILGKKEQLESGGGGTDRMAHAKLRNRVNETAPEATWGEPKISRQAWQPFSPCWQKEGPILCTLVLHPGQAVLSHCKEHLEDATRCLHLIGCPEDGLFVPPPSGLRGPGLLDD